jgi:ABC-type multidrug transport system fused ATPase/permease subunit
VRLIDLPLDQLHRYVALVTQEHHVFVGSIAENLRLASPGASDAALERALATVDAFGWVRSMPQGMETKVGSGGVVLTPAQAQQLALARLVLLNPSILVLDEATSLLDPRAARSLEQAMSRVLAGRTVVAIAHRLHTAHDADRVAVVKDGRIAEIGTHDELVAAHGEYAVLWQSWNRE